MAAIEFRLGFSVCACACTLCVCTWYVCVHVRACMWYVCVASSKAVPVPVVVCLQYKKLRLHYHIYIWGGLADTPQLKNGFCVGVCSLVPRPSRNTERGSGVLSDISWRMGRGYTA